jgi:hypothetical protein
MAAAYFGLGAGFGWMLERAWRAGSAVLRRLASVMLLVGRRGVGGSLDLRARFLLVGMRVVERRTSVGVWGSVVRYYVHHHDHLQINHPLAPAHPSQLNPAPALQTNYRYSQFYRYFPYYHEREL